MNDAHDKQEAERLLLVAQSLFKDAGQLHRSLPTIITDQNRPAADAMAERGLNILENALRHIQQARSHYSSVQTRDLEARVAQAEAVFWMARAKCYVEGECLEEARRSAERAIQLKSDPFSYVILGDILRRQGSMAAARSAYQKAVDLDPMSETGVGAAKRLSEIESAPDQTARCFVATAASGSPTSWEVVVLTKFRDSILMRGSLGRALVGAYYVLSPPLARFIGVHSSVRRACLWLLVRPAAALTRLFVR